MIDKTQEEKDTGKYKHIEDAIYQHPLSLVYIKKKSIIEAIDNYLPYSVGMEFECFQKDTYNINKFRNISNILDVDVDDSEQRYRIPSGLKGMVCLYEICKELKLNSALDLGSSNHYHFDFTDINNREDIINDENKEYILKELESWGTAIDLSLRNSWIRFFNSLGTLEIRIGEPSFDYEIIIKRLIQGSNISRRLKDFNNSNVEEKKIIKLKEELNKLTELNNIEVFPVNDIKQLIKNRTNKI